MKWRRLFLFLCSRMFFCHPPTWWPHCWWKKFTNDSFCVRQFEFDWHVGWSHQPQMWTEHALGSSLYKWASTCLGCFHCFIDSFNDYFPGKEKKERNQTLMDGKVQGINGVSAETPIPLITPYKLGKFQLSHRCSLHLLARFSPIFFHIFCFHLLGVAGFWVFWGKDGMCGEIYVFGSWVMEIF